MLVSICEKKASVYRSNSTQFVILMPGEKEDAVALINEVKENIENLTVNGKSIRITFSCGATIFPQDGIYFDNIISNLTYALSSAKQTDATEIIFYSHELYEKRNRFMRLNEALQASVENGCEGFRLVMQPVFDAKTGKLHSAEALLRWSHEDFPNIGPVDFVPVLEQTEKIIPVGRWIIDRAFKYVSEWNNSNPTNKLEHININFSYVQFSDNTLKDYIVEKLDEYKLPHETLVAELTESCRIGYTEDLAETLQSFRDEGIIIALDDFGTGYSSLVLLKNTPTDMLKLDYTMMRTIQDKPKDRTLVEFIIKYCREIDVDVCAEGIENEGIEKIVTSAGASFLQGYYYDKPLEADDFYEKYIK
jgi:EAL domain-containing protein (putative c-di-GMP-specific phosphodiesterase class I)